MYRLPTEILQVVLENLIDFRDSENASKTCTVWRDVMDPLKSSWLFGQVFPMIFEHLSKNEIIQCRLVCRHWCFAVDCILENNPYHRPVTGKFSNSELLKTDLPVNSLEKLLKAKKLDYNYHFSNYGKLTKIMKEARFHSRCPIVGRALSIWEFSNQTNEVLLEVFGRHLCYLKIRICKSPLKALETILKLLSFTPNLKTLRIEGRHLENSDYRDTQELSKFVLKYCASSGDEKRSRLPKLEALHIFMMEQEICEYWNYCLARCISPEKLESMHLHRMKNITTLKLENIVDLGINVNSDTDLENICQLSSLPLRRLSLEFSGRVQSIKLLGFVKQFGSTLRNLELILLPAHFSNFVCTDDDFLVQYKGFTDWEILSNMTDLKRVTLKGIPPPSLNFLLGVCKSLEYLHVTMESEVPVGHQRYLAPDYNEKLDLLKTLIGFKQNQIPGIYESNVWQILTRLKVLTFKRYGQEFENRRDTCDKYVHNKLSI